MTYIPSVTANVSTVNSTSTALGSGGVFTGTAEDVSQYASLSISYYVQPYTATGNVIVQFSNTATNFYPVSNTVTQVTGATANGFTIDTTMTCQYFRVIYVNDSTVQTKLMIQSIFHPQARIAIKTSRFAESMTDVSDCINSRSFIWGKTNGGNIYEQIASNGENSLLASITEPTAAFGEINVAENTPTCQVDFVYGINTQLTSNTTSNNATVTATNGMAVLTTGAQVNSVASLVTKNYVKYRPGQGSKSRFTALFTAGVAGSTQIAGVFGDGIDGVGFGYNGTSFGAIYRHSGTDTWIPQSTWNYDTMLGGTASGKVLDPTKINVFQIKFQYLGGGNIFYSILNDFSGRWCLVHMVRNAGTLTSPIFRNPSLPVAFETRNTTNTSAIVLKTASVGQFLEGTRKFLGPMGSIDSAISAIAATTQTSIVALRNASSYNGISNYSIGHLRQISVSANDSPNPKGCVNLRVVRNPSTSFTLFVPYNGSTADGGVTITAGQSTMSSNLSSITVSGGSTIYTATVNIGGSTTIDVTSMDISIYPGDILAVCAYSTTSGPTVGVSVTWNEDI